MLRMDNVMERVRIHKWVDDGSMTAQQGAGALPVNVPSRPPGTHPTSGIASDITAGKQGIRPRLEI